ncbi:MAG TPA: multicopper oxidase domain-containing protein [Nitrososphaeraceae archaeon]|nr:multicopper oxidase domain-containing protein [Nitrososphaeraceae archaeon]
MNRIFVVTGIAAGILIVGLFLIPVFTGRSSFNAQANHMPCETKHVLLIAGETPVQIIPPGNENAYIYNFPLGPSPPGLKYMAMTWNHTIPGPVISVDQCDTLVITVRNEGAIIHSMDFHAGYGDSQAVSGPIAPGESKTFKLTADIPGVFMYHCTGDALNGVWEHIASGMYGGIVVHPHQEEKAKEFYLVFGEIYSNSIIGGTTGSFDINKFKADNPDVILTNGMSHKYVEKIGVTPPITLTGPNAQLFKVKPGELTRWYIINPGPNDDVDFHFISGMIDVYEGFSGAGGTGGGKLDQELRLDETWLIPAGAASVIESVFPEEGIYVGVDHSMKDVLKGGAFLVNAISTSTATDHPDDRPLGGIDTCVSPKGSPRITCP